MISITSFTNQKIKDVLCLKKAGARKEAGRILVDGEREIALAFKAGLIIEELFVLSSVLKKGVRRPAEYGAKEIYEVTEEIFKKICYKDKPEGWLAVARTRSKSLTDIKLGRRPLVIVLEAVEKPGNLGAIIRTAYAAQADAVIINDSQTDIYNPNVIRASEGLLFAEPVVRASVAETAAWLKKNKIKTFGAATSGRKNYIKADLSGSAALVFGSEADGLSKEWLGKADELIKIPMRAGVDSLNVSVSAAVMVYEALRQRDGLG